VPPTSAANVARDLVAARPSGELAVIALGRDGSRREWTFGELAAASGAMAGALRAAGVRRGQTVLTLLGNRVEYVLTILAGLHIGAPVLPCSEQLRPADLAPRLVRAEVRAVVCDARNREAIDAALTEAGRHLPVLTVPDERLFAGPAPAYAELGPLDPAFVLFTSGTSGEPKLVTHGQRYVWGQHLQAQHWLAAEPGELVWSTAAPGWSKSARNTFIAPWLCGAAALLADRRFDPDERLATVRAERVRVLCMAPTEYRLIAGHGTPRDVPTLRRLVTAGEALGSTAVEAWQEGTGLVIADGYGQTETGHLAGVRPGEPAPPGSFGKPLPGVHAWLDGGELVVDAATVATFFLGYDSTPPPPGAWRTGDLVDQDGDGWLYFRSRADDVIISAGYRIGPAEVEAVLRTHPAVRDAAVVGTADPLRGEVVTAVVVLAPGVTGSPALSAELAEHVKSRTAPYKYPRLVRFVDALPLTTTGKVHRAALRSPTPSPGPSPVV
jgi:acyl-coenzyme A synthetase/AMP-(fatty) acid ligase